MARTTKATKKATSTVERIEAWLPPPMRNVIERAHTNDVFTYAAALAFYAIVSVVPLTILVLWLVSVVLGDDRVRQLASEVGRVAPKNLGADRIVQRVAQLGSRLGVVATITALWPATAYGSGLERAFDRLGPRRDEKLEGLRGRGLFFLVLLPVFVLGSLVGSFAGSEALGTSGLARVIGYAVALATGVPRNGRRLDPDLPDLPSDPPLLERGLSSNHYRSHWDLGPVVPTRPVREPRGELREALRHERPGSAGAAGRMVVPRQRIGAGVVSGRPGDVSPPARRRSTTRSGGSA